MVSATELSERLKKDAKGAVKSAVKVLLTVAVMTQDVPYMGTVSKVLTELLKVGEVSRHGCLRAQEALTSRRRSIPSDPSGTL